MFAYKCVSKIAFDWCVSYIAGKPTREVGVNEQHYVSSLIALNETYHNYVVSCFQQ